MAAIVTGVLRYQPARRAPWLLLAAGSLCSLAGQVLALASGPAGRPPPFPSPADGCYLASYPLYLAGLALLSRARAAGRDRRSLLDTLAVTAGAAVLTWLYLALPGIPAAGLPGLGRAAAIGYSLGELLLLALLGGLLARLLVHGGWRIRSAQLLALGGIALLAAGLGYSRLLENWTAHCTVCCW